MPTIEIAGHGDLDVPDGFFSLSPDEQLETINRLRQPKIDEATGQRPTGTGVTIEIAGEGEFQVGEDFFSLSGDEQVQKISELRQKRAVPAPVPEVTTPPSDGPATATTAETDSGSELAARGEFLPRGVTKEGEGVFAIPGFAARPIQTVMDILTGKKTVEDVTPGELLELGGLFVGPGGIPSRTAATKAVPGTGRAAREAGERVGVEVPPVVASDIPGAATAGQAAANVPIAGAPLVRGSQRAIDQLGEAVERVQGGFGQRFSEEQANIAGGRLKAGLETQITQKTRDRVDTAWNGVRGLTDPRVKSPLDKTVAVADEIDLSRRGARIDESSAVKRVLNAITDPDGLSFSDMHFLRRSIGELLDNPSRLPADISVAELKRIYGGLTDDLRVAARAAGGEKAVREFDKAANLSKQLAKQNETLNRLLGPEKAPKSNEQLISTVQTLAGKTSGADLAKLAKVRRAVDPQTWDEVSSAVISRMGRNRKGEFTPAQFLNSYNGLSRGGRRILFGSTGRRPLETALDDIAEVSKRFERLSRFAQIEGGSQTVRVAAATTLGAAIVTAPISTIASVTGGLVLASILGGARPVRAIASWGRAVEQFVQGQLPAGVMTRATAILATQLAAEMGEPDAADAIAQKLQSRINLQAEVMRKARKRHARERAELKDLA